MLGSALGPWGDLPRDLLDEVFAFLPLRDAARMAPTSRACRERLRSLLSPQQARLLVILGTGVQGGISAPHLDFLQNLLKTAFQGRLQAAYRTPKLHWRRLIFIGRPKGRRFQLPGAFGKIKVESSMDGRTVTVWFLDASGAPRNTYLTLEVCKEPKFLEDGKYSEH